MKLYPKPKIKEGYVRVRTGTWPRAGDLKWWIFGPGEPHWERLPAVLAAVMRVSDFEFIIRKRPVPRKGSK